MNWEEFKNIFNEAEIIGDKLVIKKEIYKTLSYIKENYHFEILKSITAVDLNDMGVELIYHLYNLEDEENLQVSVIVNNEAESISSIFDSAVADEKEIYDLFGIKFINHPNLKRILLPDSFIGYPLRKDYKMQDERLMWNYD